jgi:hypothetical protein
MAWRLQLVVPGKQRSVWQVERTVASRTETVGWEERQEQRRVQQPEQVLA